MVPGLWIYGPARRLTERQRHADGVAEAVQVAAEFDACGDPAIDTWVERARGGGPAVVTPGRPRGSFVDFAGPVRWLCGATRDAGRLWVGRDLAAAAAVHPMVVIDVDILDTASSYMH